MLKRLRIGQTVRIARPVDIAARFFDPDRGVIVGAGSLAIQRELLEGLAYVVSIADGSKGTRGLIAFGSPESNRGMWLSVDVLESAKVSRQ